jgi:DNA-binding transcriptional LysR family regulator
MLNLNDARMFVLVVDRGGFTPAARALQIPKSTVSKRVAALERALGTPLLHRSSRRVALTPVGRELHRRAAAIVALAEDAEAAVRGQLAAPSGVVRITSSIPTTQTWLAEVLPRIAAAYPAMSIVHHATDRFVDVVADGFDMAIRAHSAPLPDSDLRRRRLGSDPFWLVASPRYLKARGSPDHPRDLAAHDALLTRPTSPVLTLVADDGATVEVAPQVRFAADESTMLLAAARQDLGITVMPRSLCRADIDRRTLRRVLPAWTAGEVTTTLLVPERRADLPAVRVIADALVAHVATRQPDEPPRPRRSRAGKR